MADTATAPNEPTWRQTWFKEDLGDLSESTRDVLERYSKIPPDQVMSHVYDIREKAFAIHPYPCIGLGRFLDLAIGNHELYSEVLSRMRSGDQKFLDLGCAFGQDIRRLVAHGVDSARCYGSDLRLDFIDLGYELFRDRSTLKSEFIAADVFDPDSALTQLEGKIDIVGSSSFFHLFDWDEQKRVAHRIVKLLKPQKDSLLAGRQIGNLKPGNYPNRSKTAMRFRHSPESWKKFWDEVGQEVGANFEVQATTESARQLLQSEDHIRPETASSIRMEFSIRRM